MRTPIVEDHLQSSWLNRYKADGPVREDGVLLTLGYRDTTTQATALLDHGQRQLNQEENANSKLIHDEKHPAGK